MAIPGEHGFGSEATAGACVIEPNGNPPGLEPGRIAIFTASAIGYVDNPEALYARALGWGLHRRGHRVRMLEERRNSMLRRTLEVVGAAASRAAYENFPGILIHAFEPRTGAALMEWIARELSLVDLAIVVDGVGTEIARWIANLDHERLVRAYATYRPDDLTAERAVELELERYDAVFASSAPVAPVEWTFLPRAIAPQDLEGVAAAYLPPDAADLTTAVDEAVRTLETMLAPGGVLS